MDGRRVPDLFVMGLGLWDIVFSPLEHNETLQNYEKQLKQFKVVRD